MTIGDRESRFVITVEGNAAGLSSFLAGIKSQFKSASTDIEQTAGKIQLFKDAQEKFRVLQDGFAKTSKAAQDLRDKVAQVERSFGGVGADLAAELKKAEAASQAAAKAADKQALAVVALEKSLASAGVDVKQLAAEELKLAEAIKVANAAAVQQASKDLLGFKSLKDVGPQINQLNAAFRSLRDSGKLTFGELSVAQARLQQQVAALKSEAVGLGEAFSEIRGKLLAFSLAVGTVAAGALAASKNYREFAKGISAVDSIAGVSAVQLKVLENGVRDLARRLGVDAVESTKALYEIISSGIPADNALTVLEQSTRAAVAGITDVQTAAKVGVAVLNGYGLQVSELGRVFDVLFQTVQDGVVTFPELAQNIGIVIPAARAASVPIEELGAAFVVLTRQGVEAPEAATSINRAIIDLSAPAPEAADKLRKLGIEFRGLFGTIEQFASKNLSLAQINELVPDVRASRAVLALTQSFQLLKASLDSARASAGAMEAAYAKLAATPQAKVDRFNAAVKDLSISVGEFVTNSTGLVQSLTGVVNGFNSLGESTRQTIIGVTALVASLAALGILLRTLGPAINLFAGAFAAIGGSAATAATGITAASVAMGAFQASIALFAGFKLGEILAENFAPFRQLGDIIGNTAAAIDNVARTGFRLLASAIHLSATEARQAIDAFQRNRQIIGSDLAAAYSGAAEQTRQLEASQRALADSFGKATAAARDAVGALESTTQKLAARINDQLTAVRTAIQQTQGVLTSLVANLNQSVTATTQAAQQAIANINATAQAQIAALATLESLRTGEIASIRATVDIQRQASVDRLAVLNKFATDARGAFEKEAQARLEVAKVSKTNVEQVERDLATTRRGLLQSIVDAYRDHLSNIEGQHKSHIEKIAALERERTAINLDIESKIREARRQNLDVYTQYQDRVREIDENLSRARRALAAGDLTSAKEFADKAIQATAGIAGAVKEGERVVVDGFEAQIKATSRYQEAQQVLLGIVDKRKAAEEAGAAATANAIDATKAKLVELQAELQNAADKAAEGIKVTIDFNTERVAESLKTLQAQLAEEAVIVPLRANVDAIQEQIARLKRDLDAGFTVDPARIDAIKAALQTIADTKPELKVETTAALKAVEDVAQKVRDLAAIRTEIQATVKSNVAEVQAAINELKRPTESTHTIHIVTVQEQAGGGLIQSGRELARRFGIPRAFAGGGPVFSSPAWSKVPGSGDGDTVPAALQPGSYVVRKPASRYYGDGLMARVAQRFAVGGAAGKILSPGANAIRLILGDAKGAAVGRADQSLAAYDETIKQLFKIREAAANLPKSNTGLNIAEWAGRIINKFAEFDTPRRDTIKKTLGDNFEGWLATIANAQRFHVPAVVAGDVAALAFARGGDAPSAPAKSAPAATVPASGDSVPAMLTPGEWVVRAQRVRELGAGIMHAINSMSIPREALANMLASGGLISPPRPAFFANGGPVGDSASLSDSGRGRSTSSGGDITVNLNASAQDLFSIENVRRFLIPVMDEITRRKGRG